MPVTFTVYDHEATTSERTYKSAEQVLERVDNVGELLQSSINPTDYPALSVSSNGFVNAVLEAWGQHRNLVIRPDDVWIAILTQFHLYVNANAEKLRKSFVAHEGKKTLHVSMGGGSRHTVDFGWFAQEISRKLHDHVVDKDLVRWILPDFSTTTVTDTTVGAVILMATLKAYFDCSCSITCGIPKVTLAGERKDWEDILSRLSKLGEFGEQPLAWSHLLRSVITRFIHAFDAPTSEENIEFWKGIAQKNELRMCGPPHNITGWITAFCVWNKDGRWIGPPINGPPINTWDEDEDEDFDSSVWKGLILDGKAFGCVYPDSIPHGYASVNVELNDNGQLFDCEMLAGHIGWHTLPLHSASSEVGGEAHDLIIGDTIQPASAWFMFTKKREERKEEELPSRRSKASDWHMDPMDRAPPYDELGLERFPETSGIGGFRRKRVSQTRRVVLDRRREADKAAESSDEELGAIRAFLESQQTRVRSWTNGSDSTHTSAPTVDEVISVSESLESVLLSPGRRMSRS